MQLIHDRTSVHGCYYQVIFVTKYRRAILSSKIERYFQELLTEIAKRHAIEVVECEAVNQDHIKLLIRVKPKARMTSIIKTIKSSSARQILNKFPDLRETVSPTHLWSPSFFIKTVGGVSNTEAEAYIESQS